MAAEIGVGQANGLNAQPVRNNTISNKGPLALPIRPDFSIQPSYLIDLSIQNAFGTIDFVQTLFIDNVDNTAETVAYNEVSQQRIVCPPGAQGYFPFLCPNPGRFTIASNGNVVVNIELINFPVQPAVWFSSGAAFHFDGSGDLKTADKTLATVGVTGASLDTYDTGLNALVASGGLNVNVISGGGGGGGIAVKPFTIQKTTYGVIYTPAAGQKVVVHGVSVTADPGIYKTGGPGVMELTLGEGANNEIITSLGCQGTGGVTMVAPTGPIKIFENWNLDWKFGVADALFNFYMSDVIGGGYINITAFCTSEP